VLLLAAFVLVEWRTPAPLLTEAVPPARLRRGHAAGLATGWAVVAAMSVLCIVVERGLGRRPDDRRLVLLACRVSVLSPAGRAPAAYC